MFNIQLIHILFIGAGVLFVLLVFNIFLGICVFKLRKKIALLFSGKKTKNLEDVVLNNLQKIKEQGADILELSLKMKKVENILERTFQKIGVVRFNPFSNIGGNQSFVVALLDNQNNGFVISSLFIKEGNRVYAKPIRNGQSDYPLSNEEKEALEKAIHYTGKT